MNASDFDQWLEAGGAESAKARSTRIQALKRIERGLGELGSAHRDLDEAWAADRFQALLARLEQMKGDIQAGGEDYRKLLSGSEKPLGRLRSWTSWLKQYGSFCSGERTTPASDADRIRQHVLEHYIEPAREAERETVDVLVRDVNTALGLNQGWPNICQSLTGPIFCEMADVSPPRRTGAEKSSATVFHFDLGGAAAIEQTQHTLRPEINDASAAKDSKVMTPPDPTNLILYGPPGTGKTYNTAREAVRLCDGETPYTEDADGRAALMERYGELCRKKRISFVTFHQNFSYEDFVEGLRPISGSADGEPGSASGFSLQAQDGIFKHIAELAASNRGKTIGGAGALIDRTRTIFKMSLGRSREAEDDVIYQDAIEGGYVVLGWGGDVDWSDPRFDDFPAIKERWREDEPDAHGNNANIAQTYTFRANMQIGSLVVISDGNRKFRAIGQVTGPYQFVPGRNGDYNHRRAVRWLWHSDESLPAARIYGKDLSQVSAYQMNSRLVDWDALEQVVAGGGEVVATTGAPEPYVLIIDEINRANISNVFGELITLIEPDKRIDKANALKVTLPYSKTEFGVPANLHIVGTMNTADRSIALLDTALRRRFTFREMAPRPDLLGVVDGIDVSAVLRSMNDRIEYLVDREHRIGHAFFIGCRDLDEIDAVMRDKVIPLLQEYFFEDWSRIRAVLGSGFIGSRKLKAPPGFDDDRESWFVRLAFGAGAYATLINGAAPFDDPDDETVNDE